MRIGIFYYSYTGNTAKLASALAEYLTRYGQVDLVALTPKEKEGGFLKLGWQAFWRKKPSLHPLNEPSDYDLICVGSPVWAFAPAPAVNTFLAGIEKIFAKKAVLFVTYGSGAGKGRCLDCMRMPLASKGIEEFFYISLPGTKVKDKIFLRKTIAERLSNLRLN